MITCLETKQVDEQVFRVAAATTPIVAEGSLHPARNGKTRAKMFLLRAPQITRVCRRRLIWIPGLKRLYATKLVSMNPFYPGIFS